MTRPFFLSVLAVTLLTAACGSPSAKPVSSTAATGRRVIFIGLDGADWQLLDEYMSAGAMPNLARLVREGTSGVLDTIRPPLSPLICVSVNCAVT